MIIKDSSYFPTSRRKNENLVFFERVIKKRGNRERKYFFNDIDFVKTEEIPISKNGR